MKSNGGLSPCDEWFSIEIIVHITILILASGQSIWDLITTTNASPISRGFF